MDNQAAVHAAHAMQLAYGITTVIYVVYAISLWYRRRNIHRNPGSE
jgi:hypothetical protein